MQAFGTQLANQPTIQQLEYAVALYRGPFLEGFSLEDSAEFEDWSLLVREELQRQVLGALHRLAESYAGRGEYGRACEVARRQVELEPWQEEAHRQLMRLLALSGQRSAALAQYETCCRLLRKELGVEPAAETTRLYEQIRDGELDVTEIRPARPVDLVAQTAAFLDEVEPVEVARPVFVARERKLERLVAFLQMALAGQGKVVFVTGGPGTGSTG